MARVEPAFEADGMMEDDSPTEPLMEPVEDSADMMEVSEQVTEVATPAATDPVASTVKEAEPDPQYGTYTWEIRDYSRQPTKIYSEAFEAGGHFWNLLIFTKGNQKLGNLSVYLNVPDALDQPWGWSRRAGFKLHLINQLDPSKSITRDSAHAFNSREVDWGFTSFVSLDELHNPAGGLIVNDTLKMVVEVRVDRPEDHMYNSKKETGYVGLKNQGATCYMNSLLQTLYNINYFRQAVYHMPTLEEEVAAKSLPLALQSLFYKLQFGNTSVSTKDLTKSFGWDNSDAFMQHDVQELNRVLSDKIEEKMKGTKVEGTIAKLFEGHTQNFVECINVDYKSSRRESYMDLQLVVKGCKTMYDSFDQLVEVEKLEGQNQYQAEQHGMQDARKGMLFDSFPPVLQLQLRRFEYDFQRDTMIKINDRYEFPEELDLDIEDGKYLSKDADRSVRNKYRLHSVLVHSGGVHGGHYYAFINPSGDQWLKFDDEKVTKEEKKRALDEQYGGEDDNVPPSGGYNAPTFRFTKFSNAYMLVYVRETDWDQIMCKVTEQDLSEHVRERLEKEHLEKERLKKEKADAHLYTIIRVARDEDLKAQIGDTLYYDLVDHEKVKQFRVRKQTIFQDFKAQVAKELGVPQDAQVWWKWSERQNKTYRVAGRLSEVEEASKVAEIREIKSNKHLQMPLNLYLQVVDPSNPLQRLLPSQRKSMVLLFFKSYDPQQQKLTYVGNALVPLSSSPNDLEPLLASRLGLEEGVQVQVFEEVQWLVMMVNEVEYNRALQGQQIEDGDILVIQQRLQPGEAEKYKYPTAPDYMAYVRNRRVVTFKKLETPKEEGIELELNQEMTYDEVEEALAAALNFEDPRKLRFTQHVGYSGTPKTHPLRWRAVERLPDMLPPSHVQQILYYEILDLPLADLERLKTLKVHWHNEKGEQVSVHSVRLPKDSVMKDVTDELRRMLLDTAGKAKNIRLIEIYFSKIYKVFDPEEQIDMIDDKYWDVRAEAYDEEEERLSEGDRLIHVYHIAVSENNHVSHHGDPFFLRVGRDETLEEVAKRIQAKLGVSDEEFAKWKFAYVVSLRPPDYLQPGDVVASKFKGSPNPYTSSGGEAPFLGLQHAFTHTKRPQSRNAVYERPIKIYS